MKKHISLLGAVAIWALSSAAPANTSADEQAKAAIQKHISAAARLAGKEWDGLYRQRCQVDSAPLTQQQRSAAPRVERPAPPPMQVFDNLYYLGIDRVSAWALKTSDGIIIIDSLYTPEQAEEYIIGGLKKLGLKPADVRYIVVSHGHGDHFGGAQYLKGVTGARIVASAAEWDYMDSVPQSALGLSRAWHLLPKRDMSVLDAHILKLGDQELQFFVSPGHTPGALSMMFKVQQNGKSHTAALWGGTAYPVESIQAVEQYVSSLGRFAELAKLAGSDVVLSNHGHTDGAIGHMAAMRANSAMANPFIVNSDIVQRHYGVLRECGQAELIRRRQ